MTGSAVRILAVDDEPPIQKLLRIGLGAEGYALIEAPSAAAAIEAVRRERPDLILLDLGLPDLPGRELLARWRAEGLDLPIIILSSRTDEAGIVLALEQGADDYVTKPFGIRELAARIRVALRHRLQLQGERPLFHAGDLSVDLVKRIVRLAGNEVRLSPREYDILRLLVQHAGKVITHRHLLDHVWGGQADVQNLRVHVRQLRRKLEPGADTRHYITTEPGIGYRLREPD